MMSTDERLAYMADQIARNFATLGVDRAITATADHIASFWDPRMKQRAYAMLEGDRPDYLSDLAASSLRLLRARNVPASQSAATEFNGVEGVGHCDAG